MRKFKYIAVIGLILFSLEAAAQNQNSMRINEVMINNTNNMVDDFGKHNPWIELFNSSYGTVDLGGCFLTDDPDNLKKYIIPKGDVKTKVKPRQHIIFWADGERYHGTFHTNFVLEAGKEILFISSDGRTIIDRIRIPANIEENQSYARLHDGYGTDDGNTDGWHLTMQTSPCTFNSGVDSETKSMIMKKQDPYGWIMAVTAMSVVFLALIILYFIFKLTGKLSVRNANKKAAVAKKIENPKVLNREVSGETFAAIAASLHQYFTENEAHDEESYIVTMHHTDRSYSPWSSKIYGLRQLPEIKNKK